MVDESVDLIYINLINVAVDIVADDGEHFSFSHLCHNKIPLSFFALFILHGYYNLYSVVCQGEFSRFLFVGEVESRTCARYFLFLTFEDFISVIPLTSIIIAGFRKMTSGNNAQLL
jgi:hypothetical protein